VQAALPHVVVTHWVHDEVLTHLATAARVTVNPTREVMPPDALAAAMATADGMLAFMTDRVDEAFLAAAPRLKVIGCALKGFDNFDLEACRRRGVTVTIVPDLLTAPTAELTIGLVIALARHLVAGDRLVRSGGFAGWRPVLYGRTVAGSTVGLIGFGAVGRAVVKPLQALGARVIAHDRYPPAPGDAALDVARVGLDSVLSGADILILALPLVADTLHILDRAAIARLKPGVLVVNPARGSLVDEEAIADALEDGRMAGYAADVFAFEDQARPDRPPAVPERLLNHPATVLTPHLGSAVDAIRRDIAMSAARDILTVLGGGRSANTLCEPADAA
jgi:phosphonate dehydrogenase